MLTHGFKTKRETKLLQASEVSHVHYKNILDNLKPNNLKTPYPYMFKGFEYNEHTSVFTMHFYTDTD
jgi:hypothetical protein